MSMKEQIREIGNFKIGKVIGSGTFGKVREGTHIPTGEKVAIKMLEKKKIKTKKDIERIQKELQTLKDIKHPNILRLLDVKETENFIFIVTELVEGEELYDRIVRKGTLALNEACRYFCQLFEAVRFLHTRKISHRDIKPENIIVNGDNLKLIDFGLSAQWTENKTTMETPCGSPCYAAPEMVIGKKYDCRKIDIWAMGVTLYAMLMGKLPFQHESTAKLYKMIETQEFEQVQNVPTYVNLLLRAMMEKDPKKRISIKEIEENIWIKDTLQQSQKEYQNSEENQNILREMEDIFSIPRSKMVCEIIKNPISEMSTYYYLKASKAKNNLNEEKEEVHDGPFHIQFVFKSVELLEFFLEKNSINYKWIFPENLPELNDSSRSLKSFKKRILINGEELKIKRLKNLPNFIYLPLHNLTAKSEEKNTEKSTTLQNSENKSFLELESNRSKESKYYIETF